MLIKLLLTCSYQQTIQEHAFHLKKAQVNTVWKWEPHQLWWGRL